MSDKNPPAATALTSDDNQLIAERRENPTTETYVVAGSGGWPPVR